MEKMILKLKVKAGENGKTFGGVTSKEIAEELKKEYNIEIDKKKIDLKETIKLVGRFSVNIKLYEGVNQKLTLDIQAE
jgi:large subunit ribosomal protein L9